MRRPDTCPNCGASATAHTGSYCHECGEPLTPRKPKAARDDGSARYMAARLDSERLDVATAAMMGRELAARVLREAPDHG